MHLSNDVVCVFCVCTTLLKPMDAKPDPFDTNYPDLMQFGRVNSFDLIRRYQIVIYYLIGS